MTWLPQINLNATALGASDGPYDEIAAVISTVRIQLQHFLAHNFSDFPLHHQCVSLHHLRENKRQ
jgi:hypothetical protein